MVTRVLMGGTLALACFALATPARAHASSGAGGHPAARRDADAAQAAGYLSKESDFVVGKTVYLRSTKRLVGRIEKVDESHSFAPTFPKSPAKAVMIRRKDRSRSWVPVEGITRIYVVNK